MDDLDRILRDKFGQADVPGPAEWRLALFPSLGEDVGDTLERDRLDVIVEAGEEISPRARRKRASRKPPLA